MGLRVLRFPNESWREAVARLGRKQALETEVLDEYDRNIKEGDSETYHIDMAQDLEPDEDFLESKEDTR